MFETFRKFETTLAGRPLVIETGKMAQLASGSCLVRYGGYTSTNPPMILLFESWV